MKLQSLPIVHSHPATSINRPKAKQRLISHFLSKNPKSSANPTLSSRLTWVEGGGGSTFLQPGGGTGTIVTKLFGSLLDVLLQEIVAGCAVSSHSAVEQPQLVVKDFDLEVEPKFTMRPEWLSRKPKKGSEYE